MIWFLSHSLQLLLFRYSITLLVWVFPESKGGEIASYWKDSNYGVSISLENSRPVFHVYSRDQSIKQSLQGKNNLVLNQWSHIAGAYNNTTGEAILYVNRIQVANKTIPGGLELATESGLWLGYLFKGRLCQVWIFDQSLSVSEVSQVMYNNILSTPSKQTLSFFCLVVFILFV